MCVREHRRPKDADVRSGMHRVWPGAAGQTGVLCVLQDLFQQHHALTGKNDKGGAGVPGAARGLTADPLGCRMGSDRQASAIFFIRFSSRD